MPPSLSWNEIRRRAIQFSHDWADATHERAEAETCARSVLDSRDPYLDDGATFVGLYDPLAMTAPLLKAHGALDRAVNRCYRWEKFETEHERVELLFEQYEEMIRKDLHYGEERRF